MQWHIQKPVKHLRWNVLQKQLSTTVKVVNFLQNAPCQMFERVLNTPLSYQFELTKKDNNSYKKSGSDANDAKIDAQDGKNRNEELEKKAK